MLKKNIVAALGDWLFMNECAMLAAGEHTLAEGGIKVDEEFWKDVHETFHRHTRAAAEELKEKYGGAEEKSDTHFGFNFSPILQ